jgi:hypothetical protein
MLFLFGETAPQIIQLAREGSQLMTAARWSPRKIYRWGPLVMHGVCRISHEQMMLLAAYPDRDRVQEWAGRGAGGSQSKPTGSHPASGPCWNA